MFNSEDSATLGSWSIDHTIDNHAIFAVDSSHAMITKSDRAAYQSEGSLSNESYLSSQIERMFNSEESASLSWSIDVSDDVSMQSTVLKDPECIYSGDDSSFTFGISIG